jgi:hypothetical protein
MNMHKSRSLHSIRTLWRHGLCALVLGLAACGGGGGDDGGGAGGGTPEAPPPPGTTMKTLTVQSSAGGTVNSRPSGIAA